MAVETTTPEITRFLRSDISDTSLLPDQGFYPRDVPFCFAEKVSLGELLTRPLHPQAKMLFTQFDELGLEFIDILLP